MSALPSQETDSQPTDDTEVDEAEVIAEVRRIIHAHTVWVPKSLAAGSLHPMTVLKAVAALSRRDNTDKEMTWRSSDISARCGTKHAKNGMQVLADLADAGVVASYLQRNASAPYVVTLTDPHHTQRIEIPQAALWVYKWVAGNVTGPRYGAKDTAQVLRWLNAVLVASDYSPGNLRVVHDQGVAHICRRSGLSRDAYDRAWAVVRRVCKADPWITWEGTVWDDGGGHGPNVISIDWSLLPALLAPPAKVSLIKKTSALSASRGEVLSSGSGGALSASRGVRVVREPNKEVSAFVQCSSGSASLPAPAAAKTASPATKAGKAGRKETEGTVEDIRAQDVLVNGLKSPHAGDATTNNTNTDLDGWVLTVVAALVDPTTANRVPVRRADIPAITEMLRDRYEAGWNALTLAACLTKDSSPDHAVKALQWRCKHKLTDVVNYKPGVARTAKQLAEDAAYEAAASSRSIDKYDGWAL